MGKKRRKKQGYQKRKTKQKKSHGKLLLVEFLLLLVLVPVAFAIYKISQIKTYDMSEITIEQNDFHDANIDNYTNIALFGVDSRANELKNNTRSDCIMVASINNRTKEVKITSFYRDTYVYIADHGYTKLTHAYAYGGPSLAISTLNKNFDLSITDFVTVNFSALTNIIDALGGVDIKITKDELKYVNAYARDVAKINGTTVKKIKKAGKQTLNGIQATGYCRVRYTAGGDFTRAQRQRTVLQQIAQKASKANPITLYKLLNEMLPQIYTSLDTNDLLALSTGIFSYNISEDFGFPFEKDTPTIRGASVVTANTLSSNVITLHEKLFQTENYVPSSTVEYRSNEIQSFY